MGLFSLIIPIALCLFWTKSRSGYAAALIGVLLVWWLSRERKTRFGWKLPAIAAGVAASVVAAAVAVEGSSVLGRATKSLGYRVQYWQSSAAMIADHPWFGCGLGNFQHAYTQYKLPEASEEISDPHNFLVEVAATGGLPAAVILLAVLGCFAWKSGKSGEWRVASGEETDSGKGSGFRVQGSENERREARGEGRGNLGCSSLATDHWPLTTPPSNPQSLIPNPSAPLLLGGLAGFVLSLPLGILGTAPPGIMPLLIGLPLAVIAIAILSNWIREGELPRWLPAVGVVVLLIDLLAAGGIAFPGVAGSLWLLMAIGLSEEPPRTWRRWTAWTALAGTAALGAACFVTAYRPVLACQGQIRLAESNPFDAEEHIGKAIAADPLSADAWQRLAAIRFDAWRNAPSHAAFGSFEEADAAAVRLAPNSFSAWLTSGDWYFAAATAAGRQVEPAAIKSALAAYWRAVTLYPNSPLCRAKLALAYAATGDQSAFRHEATIALHLDKTTPHADKKLPADLQEKLRRALDAAP